MHSTKKKTKSFTALFLNNTDCFKSVIINGITFTRRQLDIIACILNGRATKRIAAFLSISPKTVEVHIRNIMLKLECHSQEDIIDFIEKTDKYNLLKHHYKNLLIYNSFELELKSIRSIVGNHAPTCLIIYDETQGNKTTFYNQLSEHLNIANITTIIRSKNEHENISHIKNIGSDSNVDFILNLFTTDATQPPAVVLEAQEDFSNSNQSKFSSSDHISFNVDLSEKVNYYFFMLELIKQLLPLSKIDKNILNFKANHEAFLGNGAQKWVDKKDEPLSKNNTSVTSIFLKNAKKIALAVMIFGLIGLTIYFFNINTDSQATMSSNISPSPLQTDSGKILLDDIREQMQNTQELLYKLRLKQTTARLYKYIKPSRQEILQLKNEQHELNKQLMILQALNLNLLSVNFESIVKKQLINTLAVQKQQLEIARQITTALLMYLEENHVQADKELDGLIAKLKKINNLPDVDQSMLVNSAYNLKAKIAALKPDKILSVKYYKQAIKVLPNDAVTWSNYGGLLIDMAQVEHDAKLYIEAYDCFQHVYNRIEQVQLEQLPIVSTGMAYGFTMIAKSINDKLVDGSKTRLPSINKLQHQAHELLKKSVEINPTYFNTRLYLAILFFEEKNYANALREINIALDMQPMHPVAIMHKGFILEKQKKPNEAIGHLRQAQDRLKNIQKNFENAGLIKVVSDRIAKIQSIPEAMKN